MHDLESPSTIFKQKIVATHRTKKPVTVYKLLSRRRWTKISMVCTAKAMMNTAIWTTVLPPKKLPKKAALLRTAVDRFLKSVSKAKAPRPQTLADERSRV
jgi:hypothetical protein